MLKPHLKKPVEIVMMPDHSPTVHWLGTGLSSTPGLQKLAQQERPLRVWNRTLQKAQKALSGVVRADVSAHVFNLPDLEDRLQSGDIVVSMLPASMHPEIATLCLKRHAHLVTASYLSPEMQAFNARAKELDLCFVNEIGLDPGLDHLMAFEAVSALKQSPHWHDPQARVTFKSLCGGLSEIPNDFRYRFSWSPIGVLRALKNQAVFIENQKPKTTQRAWTAVETIRIGSELFEAYPNRNSLPFVSEYGLDQGSFKIETFVRGTLRHHGWKEAWDPIFQQIENTTEAELTSLSESLWKQHALPDTENDRVVLLVSLESHSRKHGHWAYSGLIDLIGGPAGSAMAQLVSLPIASLTQQILKGEVPSGVTTAPKDKAFRDRLFNELGKDGIKLSRRISWENV